MIEKLGLYMVSLFMGTLLLLEGIKNISLIEQWFLSLTSYEIILIVFIVLCSSFVIKEVMKVKQMEQSLDYIDFKTILNIEIEETELEFWMVAWLKESGYHHVRKAFGEWGDVVDFIVHDSHGRTTVVDIKKACGVFVTKQGIEKLTTFMKANHIQHGIVVGVYFTEEAYELALEHNLVLVTEQMLSTFIKTYRQITIPAQI